jgi:hypothetical protein
MSQYSTGVGGNDLEHMRVMRSTKIKWAEDNAGIGNMRTGKQLFF